MSPSPTPSPQLYGIIGANLDHSLSPLIHQVSAQHLGIDVQYQAYPLQAAAVAAFLEEFYRRGGCGLNVTYPYKELVARLLGATMASVNTLQRDVAGWRAHSTDGSGFASGLRRLGVELASARSMVVVGDGGAALAVAAEARRCGVNEIYVLRRSDVRAAAWRSIVAGGDIEFLPLSTPGLAQAIGSKTSQTIVVQATSAPLQGDDLGYLCAGLPGDFAGVFVDLVYGQPSALYLAAARRGVRCQDGLPMLIEQARCAQDIWWGRSAPYELIAAVM